MFHCMLMDVVCEDILCIVQVSNFLKFFLLLSCKSMNAAKAVALTLAEWGRFLRAGWRQRLSVLLWWFQEHQHTGTKGQIPTYYIPYRHSCASDIVCINVPPILPSLLRSNFGGAQGNHQIDCCCWARVGGIKIRLRQGESTRWRMQELFLYSLIWGKPKVIMFPWKRTLSIFSGFLVSPCWFYKIKKCFVSVYKPQIGHM